MTGTGRIVAAITSRSATTVISLAFLVVTGHGVGEQGRGVLAALLALTTMVATIASCSTSRVLPFFLGRGGNSPRPLHSHFLSLLAIFLGQALLGSGAVVALAAVPRAFGNIPIEFAAIAAVMAAGSVWAVHSQNLFAAYDLVPRYNRVALFFKSAILLSATAMWLTATATTARLGWLIAAGGIIQAAAEIRLLKQACPEASRIDPTFVREAIGYGLRIHLDSLAGLLLGPAIVYIMNLYLDAAAVGILQASQQLASLLLIVPTILSQFLVARIATEGADGSLAVTRTYIGVYLAIAAAATTAFHVLAAPTLALVFPSHGQVPILVQDLVMCAAVANGFSMLLAQQWMARGLFFAACSLTIAVGLVCLACAILMTPKFGMVGAAGAPAIAYGCAAAINAAFFSLLWLRRAQRLPYVGALST